ncbi:MAG: KH domain-containing protein [Candidatus Pacebacteria bacterium]|nr:KH domain-containing protein [Candidatus Paceibacterota bacterium]
MERDQQFLEYVIKALVDNADDVKITRVVDEMGVLLTLSVHKDDMGKVIGRSGATAKAIRTILRVVGMKYDARVNLKIEEPEGSDRQNLGLANDRGPAPVIDEVDTTKPYERDTTVDDVINDLKEGKM